MITITNLGHASFKITSNDGTVIVDPYSDGSVPGLKFPNGQKCNFLFISHEHHDHNARNKVKVNPGKTISYIEHMVSHDKENGRLRGLTKTFIFYLEGKRIAHLGDIGDIEDERISNYFKDVDVLLCPINGFYTIGAEEAKILHERCNPKIFIPMHYFNADKKTGYEDGNQISKFKMLFPNSIIVEDYYISIEDYSKNNSVIIFEKCLQN